MARKLLILSTADAHFMLERILERRRSSSRRRIILKITNRSSFLTAVILAIVWTFLVRGFMRKTLSFMTRPRPALI